MKLSTKCVIGRPVPTACLAIPFLLAGCIQVAAPDKPIVIELNINIQQEVVYRLDSSAQELIKSEAEIF